MTVTVRAGRTQDIDEAVDIWQRAHTARRDGCAVPAEGVSRARRNITRPTAFLVVADDDGQLVGMALGMQALGDDGAGPPVPGLCHVSMVFVEPSRWGQGLGTALMRAIATEAANRGFDRAQLWTQADNPRAQRLYERIGFTRSGRTTVDDLGEEIVHYEIGVLPTPGATGAAHNVAT